MAARSKGNDPKYHKTAWGWGRTEPPSPAEVLAFRLFPWKLVYALVVSVPLCIVHLALGWSFSVWSLLVTVGLGAVLLMPILSVVLVCHSYVVAASSPLDQQYITFVDKDFERKYKGKKIPIEPLYEAYFAGKIDIVGDLLESLYQRYSFAKFVFTWEHFRFFVFQLIPELIVHSKQQDNDQVRDHYDRGNDFYGAFLGETMIYTSGIFHDENNTLEEAQRNKLELVCQKIHMKKGERHLDIGCGWGTMVIHAAKNYGTDSTGVTLAREQTQFATQRIEENKVSSSARILCMDYRDIPFKKYNKITCLEMAEHVGVRLFPKFMRQVYDMLEDDGVFYLQIAGLRRAWQYEDFMWGLFMGKYVFPGADASCPLAWVIDQAEGAGFEVHSVETVGIHYSATIKRWYDNWNKPENKKHILAKYGQHWFRKWAWFLAWSTIIAEHGSATCFQIVLHKNTRAFDRNRYIAERAHWKI